MLWVNRIRVYYVCIYRRHCVLRNYSHGVNNDVNVLTEAWLVTLAASQGCAVLAPQVLVHLRKAVKLYEADAGRRW